MAHQIEESLSSTVLLSRSGRLFDRLRENAVAPAEEPAGLAAGIVQAESGNRLSRRAVPQPKRARFISRQDKPAVGAEIRGIYRFMILIQRGDQPAVFRRPKAGSSLASAGGELPPVRAEPRLLNAGPWPAMIESAPPVHTSRPSLSRPRWSPQSCGRQVKREATGSRRPAPRQSGERPGPRRHPIRGPRHVPAVRGCSQRERHIPGGAHCENRTGFPVQHLPAPAVKITDARRSFLIDHQYPVAIRAQNGRVHITRPFRKRNLSGAGARIQGLDQLEPLVLQGKHPQDSPR